MKHTSNSTSSRLGVKQGKERDMGENNMEITENQEMGQEKMFTQEEVNRIVQSRLARARTETSPELSQREADLNKRELHLDARERLSEAGLPKELVNALNCSDKETIENSIKAILAIVGPRKTNSSGYRFVVPEGAKPDSDGFYHFSGGVGSGGPSSQHQKNTDAEIRKAMGLKG